MARIRSHFTLQRLLVAVAVVAIAFALPAAWPFAVMLSAGLLVTVFTSGLKLAESALVVLFASVIGMCLGA